MRVAGIITAGPANRFLSLALAKENELVAIFQPRFPKRTLDQKLRTFKKQQIKYGMLHVFSNYLGARLLPAGWPKGTPASAEEAAFFADAEQEYMQTAAPLVREIDDINAEDFIERLRDLDVDVVVCSGGPIYRAPLLRSVKLMLNYHTGISPLYNGTHTIWWPYANGQPRLCGGTLMVMNEAVDGGNMLAHYFPPVTSDDSPTRLFCKAIQGGARLYNEVLADIRCGKPLATVAQPQPLFYCRGIDWTLHQSSLVERRTRELRVAAYTLPERVERYWRCATNESAQQEFRTAMMRTIFDAN
jgi:folate-dependent phosphoribosylglycinamide formyltransferase PurN